MPLYQEKIFDQTVSAKNTVIGSGAGVKGGQTDRNATHTACVQLLNTLFCDWFKYLINQLQQENAASLIWMSN